LRRIWLFSANKTKSSESFSKQPTQLIVELNSPLHNCHTGEQLFSYKNPTQVQLSIVVTLWILLVVSMIEGFVEKFTNLPLPFKKFQEPEQDCVNTAKPEALPMA
jgi:hypothetical protein